MFERDEVDVSGVTFAGPRVKVDWPNSAKVTKFNLKHKDGKLSV